MTAPGHFLGRNALIADMDNNPHPSGKTGPPAEKLYAVLPIDDETINL